MTCKFECFAIHGFQMSLFMKNKRQRLWVSNVSRQIESGEESNPKHNRAKAQHADTCHISYLAGFFPVQCGRSALTNSRHYTAQGYSDRQSSPFCVFSWFFSSVTWQISHSPGVTRTGNSSPFSSPLLPKPTHASCPWARPCPWTVCAPWAPWTRPPWALCPCRP